MTRSDRAAAEKVFGALISDRGCLRKQRSLREQLQTMLADRAPMRLHGPRLFMQLQGGLPFLPVPPEMFVRARQTLNMVLTYKLKPDATLATVSALLTKIEDAIIDDVPGRVSEQDFCDHLNMLAPPARAVARALAALRCVVPHTAMSSRSQLGVCPFT